MSCPLCGNAKALLLLTSFRCPNNSCRNYCASFEKTLEPEIQPQQPEQFEQSWINYYTTTTSGSNTTFTITGYFGTGAVTYFTASAGGVETTIWGTTS